MALRQTWKDTAAVGRESAFGTSPTVNTPWYENSGSTGYFMLPITGGQSNPQVEKSAAASRTGYREMYNYTPVVGNRLTETQIQGEVFPVPLGVLLYQAFGAPNSSQTADAANPLDSIADLSSASFSITPTDAAFLRFVISSAAGSGMSITVTGTDANGNSVSETLNVVLGTGAANVQTRYSYSTVSTCTAAGFSSGACTVNGYTKATHTFTLADNPITYTMVNLGDPSRGADQAGFYKGAVLTQLDLDMNAGRGGGAVTYGANYLGMYPTLDTDPTLYPPVDAPFAGWNMSITRDAAAYYRVVSGTLSIKTNNNLVWVADGDQDPRYTIGGQFEVTGKLILVAEDDTEWGDYEDNSERNLEITLTNPYDKLTSAINKSLLLELSRNYYTAAQAGDLNGAQTVEVDITPIRHSSDGVLKATLINNVYSY